MWDLWWSNWHLVRFFSEYFSFLMPVIQLMIHTHLSSRAGTAFSYEAMLLRDSVSLHPCSAGEAKLHMCVCGHIIVKLPSYILYVNVWHEWNMPTLFICYLEKLISIQLKTRVAVEVHVQYDISEARCFTGFYKWNSQDTVMSVLWGTNIYAYFCSVVTYCVPGPVAEVAARNTNYSVPGPVIKVAARNTNVLRA